jgi:hypothetical protein
MLRYVTETGSIEATAQDERRVRALSDENLCGALRRTAAVDPFLVAEARSRPSLLFHRRYGWIPRSWLPAATDRVVAFRRPRRPRP